MAMAVPNDQNGDYFDIVLIGRTGFGKSETGNKLLKIRHPELRPDRVQEITAEIGTDVANNLASVEGPQSESFNLIPSQEVEIGTDVDPPPGDTATDDRSYQNIKLFRSKITGLLNQTTSYFKVSHDMDAESTTKQCQLLSNSQDKIRVLDVCGFADSEEASAKNMRVYEVNLATFRNVLRIQYEHGIKFNRVAYFLPTRGPPEKADGCFQEELKVLYYFLGMAVFDSMVIIATNQPDERYQRLGFEENDKKKTQRVFLSALKKATKLSDDGAHGQLICPPVVYIAHKESGDSILKKLREAKVQNTRGLICTFVDGVCSKCATKFQVIQHESREAIPISVCNQETDEHRIKHCHPAIIPKFSKVVNKIGEILYIATHYIKEWKKPDIPYSYAEICPHCQKSPGSPGCVPVGQRCEISWYGKPFIVETVKHDSKLDQIQIVD